MPLSITRGRYDIIDLENHLDDLCTIELHQRVSAIPGESFT